MQMLASSSFIEKSIKGLDLALDEGTDWRKLGFDTGRADGAACSSTWVMADSQGGTLTTS